MQLQFDYNYSKEEMELWIEKRLVPMAEQARKGVLFFNNHVRAQAPQNARRMIQILKEQGVSAG